MSYQSEYQQWRVQPDAWWLDIARQLAWHTSPTLGHSQTSGEQSQWFADGVLNTCYLALDHHVAEGRADQTALIYDSPVRNKAQQYSYRELLQETLRVADMLKRSGVEKGDRVIIYMPMVPEAAVAMLACARIGAIHSVVFGGFAAPELASRIDDAKPKVILSASCGIEIDKVIEYKPLLDEALRIAKYQPARSIILQLEPVNCALDEQQSSWAEAISTQAFSASDIPAEPLASNFPLYILYTSGTTGKPKGVVREHGGHAVALNFSMGFVYNMQAGDVFWSASDIGWVVGHSYIVYGPLIRGCTTVFYEGKPIRTPDAGAFWRVVEDYQVNALFSAPTAFRAIRREDPQGKLMHKYDLGSLRNVFAAGERLDPATQQWMQQTIGVPVIDNWWQTETGWPIAANPVGVEQLSIKQGSAGVAMPGYDIAVLDDNGKVLGAQQSGNIAIKLPLPPGCLTTIWGDHPRFNETYLARFKGYYASGDGGFIDNSGYLFVMGRVDDVINVAGHRLSTGDLEEVLASHELIAECAVVSQKDELKGEVPVGFVVLNSSKIDAQKLVQELSQLVRDSVGAIACYKQSIIVPRLPKTRSGKILRKNLKSILEGEPQAIPPTIEDPTVLDEINAALISR